MQTEQRHQIDGRARVAGDVIDDPVLLHTGGVARLRVLIHLAAACAVLGLALAVGRWLRDPEPGGPLVAIFAVAAVIALCAHRLYREGGIGRRAPTRAAEAQGVPGPRENGFALRSPQAETSGRRYVDLNHASLRELQTLPGVGKVTAERIVEERERGGPFDSVADLARVGGIGPVRIRAIAERARTS
jgi:competence ComEA-like helix-hairpin-helix protein